MKLTALRSIALAVVFALAAAGPASASPETLQRSISNLTQFPLDIALAPYTGVRRVVINMRDIGDTTGVRVFYALPGVVFIVGLNVMAAVLRGVIGAIELLPGLGLLFAEADLDVLYVPVENNEALVEIETPVMPVKFGIDYTTTAY